MKPPSPHPAPRTPNPRSRTPNPEPRSLLAPPSQLFGAMIAAFVLASLLSSSIEGLPPEAPRAGTVITIDLSTNQAYLFRDGALVRKSRAATGSEKILKHGRRVWWFRTPRGRHTVVGKIKDPVWNKPDWAFVE